MLTEYELIRQQVMARNNSKLSQLGVASAALALQSEIRASYKPSRKLVARKRERSEATRRSSRVQGTDPVSYSEIEFLRDANPREPRMQANKRRRVTSSEGARLVRGGIAGWTPNMPQAPAAAADRARDAAIALTESLKNHACVKDMSESQVAGGFWMQLPKYFVTAAYPSLAAKRMVSLETNGYEWSVILLNRPGASAGLSGGWRGYAIDQMLFPNDTVVIEKLSEAALRGHIFRAWDYVDEVQEGPRPDRVPHSGGREGNKPSSALPTARTYQYCDTPGTGGDASSGFGSETEIDSDGTDDDDTLSNSPSAGNTDATLSDALSDSPSDGTADDDSGAESAEERLSPLAKAKATSARGGSKQRGPDTPSLDCQQPATATVSPTSASTATVATAAAAAAASPVVGARFAAAAAAAAAVVTAEERKGCLQGAGARPAEAGRTLAPAEADATAALGQQGAAASTRAARAAEIAAPPSAAQGSAAVPPVSRPRRQLKAQPQPQAQPRAAAQAKRKLQAKPKAGSGCAKQQSWNVEKIMGWEQGADGSRRFLIRWEGWAPKFDSLEPQDHLNSHPATYKWHGSKPEELVREYEALSRQQAIKRQRGGR